MTDSPHRLQTAAFVITSAVLAMVTLTACSQRADESTTPAGSAAGTAAARPDQVGIPGRFAVPLSDPGMQGIEVPAYVDDVAVERRAPVRGDIAATMRAEIPRSAAPRRRGTGYPVPEGMFAERSETAVENRGRRTRSSVPTATPPATTAEPKGGLSVADDPSQAGSGLPFVVQQFNTLDFDQNANVTGFFSIPPDSHVAAGPNHIMTVVNTTIQAFSKSGGKQIEQSLRNFFAPLAPLTGTFDPKVLFDTQSGRWVVVTLEQTDKALGDPADTSRILVAASDDADPNGTWFMTSINGATMIDGTNHWADYPGFGVDEEAIYITTNMFQFFSNAGNFGGVRLWIIPKGELYAGQAVNVRRVDPYAGGGFSLTTQPAQFYGDSGGLGGILVGYSGLNDGTDVFVQIMRVNNPLGAIGIDGPDFVNLGPLDQVPTPIPGATQQGSSELIVTNNRRALNATWINGRLYTAFTIRASGQATAHWVEMVAGASGTPTLDRQASIPGEELGAGTHTYYPAVAANARGDVVVGYSASSPSSFAGSYYSIYSAGQPVSAGGDPQLLSPGQGAYFRQFGTSNRWGDYSGAVIDPVDGCFWVFNQFAATPGTPLGNTGDGRWATSASKICLALGFAQAPDQESN